MDSVEEKMDAPGILSRTDWSQSWSDRLQVLGCEEDGLCVWAPGVQHLPVSHQNRQSLRCANFALPGPGRLAGQGGRASRGCVSLNKAEFNLSEDCGRHEKGGWEERGSKSLAVCLGCCNKVPQTGWP